MHRECKVLFKADRYIQMVFYVLSATSKVTTLLQKDPPVEKKVLVIDDPHFSKVCSAILKHMGLAVEVPERWDDISVDEQNYKLVIGSYPLAKDAFLKISTWQVPFIILSDTINRELTTLAEDLHQCHCFLKPLDYDNFRCIVGSLSK